MIKDLGNCGNIAKIERIYKAFEIAKHNNCGLRLVLDPLVYGKDCGAAICHSDIARTTIAVNKTDLFIMKEGETIGNLPWWDIVKIVQFW